MQTSLLSFARYTFCSLLPSSMVSFKGLWNGYCKGKIEEVLESPDAKQILDGSHVLLNFTVGGAVLISQLLLLGWPENFFGFCLLSPAVAVGLLGVLAVTAWPACQASLPLVMGSSYVRLTAWMSVFGAVFHLMPLSDNRAVFTLLNTLIVTLGLYLSSRKRVPDKLKEVMFSAASGKKEAASEEKDA